MLLRASVAASCLVVLAACGGSSDGGADEPAEVAATATDIPAAPPKSAEDLAASLAGAIPSITKTVTITEDNDPNDSIGRPGKYTEAVSIYDKRAECEEDLDVTCGGKIEVFDTEAAAQERKDFIQQALKDNPILGSEYGYVLGATLLRVSGTLKPSEAKEYERAAGTRAGRP